MSPPHPTVMLTAYAHFVDNNDAIPGVRVGSDLRVYQKFMPVTHRLAVLEMLAMAADWTYALVFVYKDEYGDGSDVSESMAILRVPNKLTGSPNGEYVFNDEFQVEAERVGWKHIGLDRYYEVAITFPATHPCSSVRAVEYDAPYDLEPSLRVVRNGMQTGTWPIEEW